MAFSIITKQTGQGNRFEWHIGTPKPKFDVPATEEIIILLQADGHELELIKKRFNNLPHAHAICTWRGAMAQFIYDNI